MRIAIFSCEDAEKWKGWTERLWRALLESSGDTFTIFRCHQGEFPDPATCRSLYDAIVVGGSHYSAYDDLPWIRQLTQLLPLYIDSGMRVVGCCFGHQILAKALGGTVGQNPSGRFVLGIEEVIVDAAAARECGLLLQPPTLRPTPALSEAAAAEQPPLCRRGIASSGSDDAAAVAAAGSSSSSSAGAWLTPPLSRQFPFAEAPAEGVGAVGAVAAGDEGSGESGSRPRQTSTLRLQMLQSHGDQVLALPPGASLLASSGTAAHEMWALGDRCLAFQFHPELTSDLLYDKIWTALSASGRLNPAEATAAEAQLKAAGPGAVDSDLFIQALNAFLRAPPPKPRHMSPPPAPAWISASDPDGQDPDGQDPDPADSYAAATTAEAAAAAAEAVGSCSVQVAKEMRRALESRAGDAAEAVLGHVRHAAATCMAAGTADAELLTALTQEAAAAYCRAATAAEGASSQLADVVVDQQVPLKAALASLDALEAQLDRLAAVVGSLERESAAMEARAEEQAREARGQQR